MWPPRGTHLETLAATIATIVLIISSGTIHLAGIARDRGDRVAMHRWLVLTIALGALFFANQIREFFVLDFSPSSSSLRLDVLRDDRLPRAARVRRAARSSSPRSRSPPARARSSAGRPAVESVSYFWHFVDVVWILLFLTLFVLR